jgi:hypothetical protein
MFPTACARCAEEFAGSGSIMSVFNTDQICLECKQKEEAHPDYEKARKAEAAAVSRGDYNYAGIGKPADL